MMWLAGAVGLFKRVPREVWIIAAALAAIALYGHHREAQGRYEGRAEMQAKIDRADAERAKALASEEQAIKALAKRTDSNVEQARAANRDRVEAFISRGGLQCPSARSDNASNRSAGSSAPVHQTALVDGTQPVQVVGVTAEDVRVCTDVVLRAEGMRDFILGLERGQADRP